MPTRDHADINTILDRLINGYDSPYSRLSGKAVLTIFMVGMVGRLLLRWSAERGHAVTAKLVRRWTKAKAMPTTQPNYTCVCRPDQHGFGTSCLECPSWVRANPGHGRYTPGETA